jgi:hypothetical protein
VGAPSDPLVDVCLAQLPAGETNPLSGKSLTSNTKITVKITVGLLPYISIASVWRKQRRVARNLDSYRQRLDMDTSSCRRERLGDLAMGLKVIPAHSYFFGDSWKNVNNTLVLAMEQDGDPYAVMVPIAEIIRFYYAPSTRLAQALFWGLPSSCLQVVPEAEHRTADIKSENVPHGCCSFAQISCCSLCPHIAIP